jgi:hypothetical protein
MRSSGSRLTRTRPLVTLGIWAAVVVGLHFILRKFARRVRLVRSCAPLYDVLDPLKTNFCTRCVRSSAV